MKLSPSFCTQEAGCVYGLFRGLSPHLKNIAASSRHTRRLAPGLACQGDPDGAEVCVWVGVGWGQAPWEGDTKTPGSGHIPASGRLLSLLSLPTPVSWSSPHISESALFSDRRGGCTGGLAEGARLPDLHSPLQRSRALILSMGHEHRAAYHPAGVDSSPVSIPLSTRDPPHHNQRV